jgi:hypothetical protein
MCRICTRHFADGSDFAELDSESTCERTTRQSRGSRRTYIWTQCTPAGSDLTIGDVTLLPARRTSTTVPAVAAQLRRQRRPRAAGSTGDPDAESQHGPAGAFLTSGPRAPAAQPSAPAGRSPGSLLWHARSPTGDRDNGGPTTAGPLGLPPRSVESRPSGEAELCKATRRGWAR